MNPISTGASSPVGSSAARLLCLPGAGASAARFEQLRRHLAGTVELRTFELPSRGIRFAEPPFTSLSEHVAHFVRHIEAEPFQRWVLLGESLGAVTAASVAAELADSMRAEVVGVITVSAAPGTTGRRSRHDVLAQLAADARGTASGELIALAADAIGVDIDAAHAAAEVTDVPPVAVPLATIRGRADSLVSDDGARRWEGLARAGWWYREVGGNHFQFERPTGELLGVLREALSFALGGPAAPGRG